MSHLHQFWYQFVDFDLIPHSFDVKLFKSFVFIWFCVYVKPVSNKWNSFVIFVWPLEQFYKCPITYDNVTFKEITCINHMSWIDCLWNMTSGFTAFFIHSEVFTIHFSSSHKLALWIFIHTHKYRSPIRININQKRTILNFNVYSFIIFMKF